MAIAWPLEPFALHNQLERFVNHDGHRIPMRSMVFKLMLDKILGDVSPSNVLVAFDAGKVTFRTKAYADYKGGGRSKTPTELSEQFPHIKNYSMLMGSNTMNYQNMKLMILSERWQPKAEKAGYQVTIVTGDRDLTQLTTDKTTVAVTIKKG